jgi:hypothetical protein
VLVSGATLFGRSLVKLLSIELGIRAAHVTTAGVLLSRGTAADFVHRRPGVVRGIVVHEAPESRLWDW